MPSLFLSSFHVCTNWLNYNGQLYTFSWLHHFLLLPWNTECAGKIVYPKSTPNQWWEVTYKYPGFLSYSRSSWNPLRHIRDVVSMWSLLPQRDKFHSPTVITNLIMGFLLSFLATNSSLSLSFTILLVFPSPPKQLLCKFLDQLGWCKRDIW